MGGKPRLKPAIAPGQIVEETRRGVVINGALRSIHHATEGCGQAKVMLVTDDWNLVTCRSCFRAYGRDKPRTVDGQLPEGVRFSQWWTSGIPNDVQEGHDG